MKKRASYLLVLGSFFSLQLGAHERNGVFYKGNSDLWTNGVSDAWDEGNKSFDEMKSDNSGIDGDGLDWNAKPKYRNSSKESCSAECHLHQAQVGYITKKQRNK